LYELNRPSTDDGQYRINTNSRESSIESTRQYDLVKAGGGSIIQIEEGTSDDDAVHQEDRSTQQNSAEFIVADSRRKNLDYDSNFTILDQGA